MSRGKNMNSLTNSNVLHTDLITSSSHNITINNPSTSVESNGRLPNTVNLDFFVISKLFKNDVAETDSNLKLNHFNYKTTDKMKLTKFNTRDRRRGVNNINQNLSEEQQRLPFSTIKNGINLNNNKLKQSNNNKIYSSNSSFVSTEFNNIGSLRRDGKEDYWYYDSRSDGFYYELNGSRGWRKHDKKHKLNSVSSQQQMRLLVPSLSSASSSAAVTNIVNSVSNSIFSTHQHQSHKSLSKNNLLLDSKDILNSTSKFFPIINNRSINNYYDELTDGYYFEMASVDGWRRRQLNNNQQILSQQSRVYSQYQQPQSRIIRQLHNQYNKPITSGQNNVFINPEAFKLNNKPQFNMQDIKTRNMSNAELDDMIISRNEDLLNIANDLAILNFHKEHFSKTEKCYCDKAVENDLVVKNLSSTSLTSTNSSLPNTLVSNLKYQIPLVSTKNSNKEDLFIEKDPIATNGHNNCLIFSSLQHQESADVQHQRNLQPSSFEEHYEFYADSDKTSHENTPSVSSIDDLQQTIPINNTQQYQTNLENITFMKNYKDESFSYQPNSLRNSNWSNSNLHEQKSYVNMEEFIADIPALNDNYINFPLLHSNESFSQFSQFDSFFNVCKNWMWDPTKSEIDLTSAVLNSNNSSTSFSNFLKKNSTYSMFEEKLDANAVLEQNVKDIAKFWQCPAF